MIVEISEDDKADVDLPVGTFVKEAFACDSKQRNRGIDKRSFDE